MYIYIYKNIFIYFLTFICFKIYSCEYGGIDDLIRLKFKLSSSSLTRF